MELIAPPAKVVIRSELLNNQLIREGHVTRSKVVMNLVDFQARMETVLKEMR